MTFQLLVRNLICALYVCVLTSFFNVKTTRQISHLKLKESSVLECILCYYLQRKFIQDIENTKGTVICLVNSDNEQNSD